MPYGNILAEFVARFSGAKVTRAAAVARMVALAFGFHTALILGAMVLSDSIPCRAAAGFVNPAVTGVLPFIAKLIRWDAHWYTYIAEYGYTSQNIVFFPAIIMLIKMLAWLGADYITAGFFLCNLFTLISYYMMAKIFLLDFSVTETKRALLVYAVIPTTFFLNSVYTEPLFLVFSLACLYWLRAGGFWRAGMFAALAAVTRNLGIALVLVLFLEYAKYYRAVRKFKLSLLSIVLPVMAVAVFVIYNKFMFGDALAFIHSQQLWGRRVGFPWDNIWHNLRLLQAGVPLTEAGMYLDMVLVVLTLTALLAVSLLPRYRIPWPYIITGWLWFLVPLFSTSPIYPLYSMARFVLIVLPLYLFVAKLPNAVFYVFICASAAGLIVCTAFFINWYWLG